MTSPKKTRWKSGGVPYVVTTHQGPEESDIDFCARHDAAVAYWEGIYPPD